MNKKLSDAVISELSFLTSEELRIILQKFDDSFNNSHYEMLRHMAKTYTDEQIIPLLPIPPKVITRDKRTRDEKLQELRGYYTKENIDETRVTTSDIPILKRGRSKSKDGTLKDKIFKLLDMNLRTGDHADDVDTDLTYENILKSGIVNIAENTYKTILSQWRKEKGFKVKRGRPSKN